MYVLLHVLLVQRDTARVVFAYASGHITIRSDVTQSKAERARRYVNRGFGLAQRDLQTHCY